MPFGERTGDGGLKGLQERILTQRPLAPHVLNPRVPLAVSRLCMTLLAASPADRFPNVPELCGALQEALAKAEGDPAWEVPLMDPHAPQVSTTDEDPALLEPNERLRAYRKRGNRRPRRGLLRPDASLAPVEASEKEEPKQDQLPTVDAPGSAARSVGGGLSATGAPVQVVPGRLELSALVMTRSPHVVGRLGPVAALLTVAVGVLYLSAGAWRGASSRTGKGDAELTRPSMAPGSGSTHAGGRGREVAPAPKPLESLPGEGAVPVGALPPAPTANAMPRTPAQTKKNETQTQRAGLRLPVKPATVAAAAVAGCTLMEGCTSSTPQVRHEPPAIACPQGWQETHKRFNVTRRGGLANMKGYDANRQDVARVKDGPVTLQVGIFGSVGDLPDGTLLLGKWQLGDNRLFGTFTEAKIPGEGTLPVCLVAGIESGGLGFQGASYFDERRKEFLCSPGLGVCLTPGSTLGNASTPTRVFLRVPVGQP